MYVCMSMHAYIYRPMHVGVYVLPVCMYVCMYASVCMHVYVCIYIYMHVGVYVLHVCMYLPVLCVCLIVCRLCV